MTRSELKYPLYLQIRVLPKPHDIVNSQSHVTESQSTRTE